MVQVRQCVTHTMIHCSFINHQMDTAEHPQTTARPRRKPKAPKGALALKLKAKAGRQQQQQQPVPAREPSPLPPSSPFASSSQSIQDLPVATSDAHDQENGKRFFEEAEAEEDHDFESDCYGKPEEEVDAQETVYSAPNSDPFGFFALEAKLKAERAQHPTNPLRAPFTQPLKVPRSPHKSRIRKDLTTASRQKGLANGDSPSLPSSPSPAKPRRATKRGLTQGTNSDETEKEHPESDKNTQDSDTPDDQPQKPPKPKVRGKGKQRQPMSDKSIDPEVLARDLKALLPKRASRKRRADSESEESDPKPRRRSKRDRQGRKDAVVKEKDAELQKRIEYFKKLEGYKVAKENVYVI
ncbi:hypothetical protein F5880DRAFT_325234 [Lentinula raphanica]|nr:hypothetical protein F5880DRAFT_325234 [Lentinula raphanica]